MRIGIFDSGVGGLTVYRELKANFPNASFYYLGDTARIPYGPKSPRAIRQFAREAINFLCRFELDYLVIACNTVSAVAMEVVQKESPVPVLGVVDPPCQVASASKKSGNILVLGTEATIRSRAYQIRLELAGFKSVYAVPCPLFVPLVEDNILSGSLVQEALKHYLSGYQSKNLDAVILGCTHYPLLTPEIQAFFGDKVNVISSSTAAAQTLANLQIKISKDAGKDAGKGGARFFVTDDPDRFERVAHGFIFDEAVPVELVSLTEITRSKDLFASATSIFGGR